MKNKVEPIFLIKKLDSNLFLYSFFDDNTDQEEVEFRELEVDNRITSIMGLTDDRFNDQYDAHLLSFNSEVAARSYLRSLKVSIFSVEVVRLNVSFDFESV